MLLRHDSVYTKKTVSVYNYGRTKHYINSFGEELMVHNAEVALQQACLSFNTELVEFTAAPKQIYKGIKDAMNGYRI